MNAILKDLTLVLLTDPNAADPNADSVDVLHVALPQVFHQHSGAIFARACEQQVNVVGHQHAGVDGATELVGKLFEIVQLELIILFAVETDRAVIAALQAVPGNAGEGEAGAEGHGNARGA